jgi:hypothetical protein
VGIPDPVTTTRVRVVGASAVALRRLRAIAPPRVDVVDEPIAEPDWIIVATGDQRIEAIRSSRLPPFRVLEVPAITGDLDPSDTDALRAALVKIAGIGVWRAGESPLGVRLASILVRRLTAST